jgi:hypothetical protein
VQSLTSHLNNVLGLADLFMRWDQNQLENNALQLLTAMTYAGGGTLPAYSGPSDVYPSRDPVVGLALSQKFYASNTLPPLPDDGSFLTEFLNLIDVVEHTIGHLANSQELRRGGITSSYSSLFLIPDYYGGCLPLFTELDAEVQDVIQQDMNLLDSVIFPPQKDVSKIKIVSDGQMGSTGSVVPTTAYTYGLASVVTFGGIQGQPMDITSFNGGNVNQWNDFWPTAAPASFFWNTVLSTPSSQGCSGFDCPWSHYLPVPGKITASYAQSGHILVDQLGEESLWREWYLLPGSHHVDFWPAFGNLANPAATYADASTGDFIIGPAFWQQLHHLYQQAKIAAPATFQCDCVPCGGGVARNLLFGDLPLLKSQMSWEAERPRLGQGLACFW